MEWAIERKEREEKRGNIVVRGARLEKGREKEGLKKIVQLIGVEVEVKDMWEVMGRTSLLKGWEERTDEDLTWAERRMKWKLREIAAIKERRGNRVRIGYAKIWIEGKMWKWDEIGEVLRDGTGRAREEGQREGRGKVGESDRERSASEERQEGSIEAQGREGKSNRRNAVRGKKGDSKWGGREGRGKRGHDNKENKCRGGEMDSSRNIRKWGSKREDRGIEGAGRRYRGRGKSAIGGDFNARTGQEGGGCWREGEEESGSRISKDRKINSEGRQLVQFLDETGWAIMNGNIEGDEEGEFTYVGGAGVTVIDYAIGDIEVRDRVKRIEIGDRVDSDHHPVIVWLRGAVARTRKGKRVGGTSRGDWTEEGRMRFRAEVKWEGIGEVDVGKEIEKRIREFRRALDGEGEGNAYKKERREYNRLCEERKKKENEGFIKEAAEARTESKVWKIVDRERKKWKRVNEEIGDQEWREYFMGLLGGVESKVTEGGETVNRKGDGEGELQREEIKKVIGKLRDGKAPGGME
ncbi:uncharacterized protein LOC124297751 [Neodiprion virginianus]|uniref:uncharacterized protein LOC124297751 n=1 Tax=Neodiprion virginianus TaxID=2961670 RepID=UPI001EE77518|nr:uncharacterized protein LOC124297751 [Neodiprion virginianus]